MTSATLESSRLLALPTVEEVAQSIDHAILAPITTDAVFDETLELAAELGLFSICVPSSRVKRAVHRIERMGSDLKVGTVVGFPHGNASVHAIRREIEITADFGAVEVDAVIDIGLVLSDQIPGAVGLIESYAELSKARGIDKFKVIYENAYLNDEQIVHLSRSFARVEPVDFIKTSTGYAPSGAKLTDVQLMVEHGGTKEVKASGGIRSLDDYLTFRKHGVTRFGTSNSAVILRDLASRIETGEATGEIGGTY